MPENPVGEIFEGIMETIAYHMPKQKSVRFLEEENSMSQQINKLFGRQEENPVSQQINKLFGQQEENPISAQMTKLFGRQQTIHNVFGGGKPADVVLWRNKKVSSSVLVGATAIWVLFEWLNYHFLTLACFALVAGMIIQFLWTHASGLMNSSPSSIPRIVLPQKLFVNIGISVVADVNRFLCFLQDVASGRDLKQFVMDLWQLILFPYSMRSMKIKLMGASIISWDTFSSSTRSLTRVYSAKFLKETSSQRKVNRFVRTLLCIAALQAFLICLLFPIICKIDD